MAVRGSLVTLGAWPMTVEGGARRSEGSRRGSDNLARWSESDPIPIEIVRIWKNCFAPLDDCLRSLNDCLG